MSKIYLTDEIKALASDYLIGNVSDETFVNALLKTVGRDDESLAAHAAWMIASIESVLGEDEIPAEGLDAQSYAQTLAIRHSFGQLLGEGADDKIQSAVAECKVQIPAYADVSDALPFPLHPRIVYCTTIGEAEVTMAVFSDAALAALSHSKEVTVKWRDGKVIAMFKPDPNADGKKWIRITPVSP